MRDNTRRQTETQRDTETDRETERKRDRETREGYVLPLALLLLEGFVT